MRDIAETNLIQIELIKRKFGEDPEISEQITWVNLYSSKVRELLEEGLNIDQICKRIYH